MKLIINADDFGMTRDVNKAIIELCNLGVTTSTTVMVNMPYYNEITELAKNDKISIGLHVNLTEGKPVCNPSEVSSLVNSDGVFHQPNELRFKVRSGNIDRNHVLKELNAQFDRLYEIIGDRIDHFDSHQGTNKHKIVTNALKIIAKNRNLNLGIRVYNKHYLVPTDNTYKLIHPRIKDLSKFGIKRILVEQVLRLRTKSLSSVFYHPTGLILTDHHKALNVLKILSEKNLNELSSGIFEIAFHPSTSLIDLPAEMSQSRIDEYNYMKSEMFITGISKYKLINYDSKHFKH